MSLIERIQAGDQDAWADLYTQTVPKIRRYLAKRMGTDDVDDLLSSVYIEALRRIDSYEDRGYPFSAWLYRIAQSRSVDSVRKQKVRNETTIEDWFAHDDAPEISEAPIDMRLLLFLTPAQRQVIEARFLRDQSFEEIASALGLTVGAVKALQHRGLEHLRDLAESLTPPRRSVAHERVWTADDDARVRLGIERGWNDETISAWLGRTATAIHVRATRLGLSRRAPTTATARDVARALGVKCAKTVMRWAEWGWLPAQRSSAQPGAVWRFLWSDVWAFCENRMYWMAWHPERIVDLARRSWALGLRKGQPCWLTPGEVARRTYVSRNVVNSWISKGEIPATRYGNWWIWSADLDGWTPPGERPRKRRAIPPTNDRGWVGTVRVAARCGVDRGTVTRWIQRGVLPATRRGHYWFVHEADLECLVLP